MFKRIILMTPLLFCQQSMAATTSIMMSVNIIQPVAINVSSVDFGTVVASSTPKTLHKTGTYSIVGDGSKAVHVTIKPMMKAQQRGVSFGLSLSNSAPKSSKMLMASPDAGAGTGTYYVSLTVQPNAKAGRYSAVYQMTATYN